MKESLKSNKIRLYTNNNKFTLDCLGYQTACTVANGRNILAQLIEDSSNNCVVDSMQICVLSLIHCVLNQICRLPSAISH